MSKATAIFSFTTTLDERVTFCMGRVDSLLFGTMLILFCRSRNVVVSSWIEWTRNLSLPIFTRSPTL